MQVLTMNFSITVNNFVFGEIHSFNACLEKLQNFLLKIRVFRNFCDFISVESHQSKGIIQFSRHFCQFYFIAMFFTKNNMRILKNHLYDLSLMCFIELYHVSIWTYKKKGKCNVGVEVKKKRILWIIKVS